MPIYEYACRGCGQDFQLLRSIRSMDKKADCPNCNGVGARHLSVFATFGVREQGDKVTATSPGMNSGGGCCGGSCCGVG